MELNQDAVNAIMDTAESLAEISSTLRGIEPSVKVNVPQPQKIEVKAPDVNITSPPANVTVTIKRGAWNFKITKRDLQGRIESFTATPIE